MISSAQFFPCAGEEAAEGGADTGSEIIFYPDLGLAVEKPKEGTLEALWDLL